MLAKVNLKIKAKVKAGKLAQQLSALDILAEALGSIPSTHMVP